MDGQRVSGVDKLHLTAGIPTMIMRGGRDPIIPATHAQRAVEALPGARLELFENSGHFPHCDEPVRFLTLLLDFLAATAPVPVTSSGRGHIQWPHPPPPGGTCVPVNANDSRPRARSVAGAISHVSYRR
jgi:hypothetical protein